MLVQEPVQAAIWHCLNHYNYWNATFLAEKLQDEINNEESLYLLATCYYRSGKTNQARSLLQSKGTQSPQCQYLLAKCCLDLNKLAEAEGTLMGSNIFKQKSLDDVVGEYGDAAAFALMLLGQVYMQTERKTKAIEALNRALKLNPFLWSAFELLCRLGEKPDADHVFQLDGLESFSHCHGTNPIASLISTQGNLSHDAGSKHQLSSEPMLVDQISTPTPQPPTAVANVVNTSTPLPCVPLIHHNIPNLTPDDQMIPQANAFSTLAPSRSKSRSFRLRSVFNAGQTLSPMSPNFGVIPLDSSSASDASQSSLVYLCPTTLAPTISESKETKTMPRRLGGRREAATSVPTAPSRMGVFCQSGNTATPTLSSPPAGSVRRSTRLYSSNTSVKENNKSSSRFAVPKLPLKRSKSKLTKGDTPEGGLTPINDFPELIGKLDKDEEKPIVNSNQAVSQSPTNLLQQAVHMQKQSAEGLMSLLRIAGKAYSHLTSYESRLVLDAVELFSPRHRRSSWVLSLMAKAYFELADYKQAAKLFQEVREMEPFRTEWMEYYSTALWHLQQEVPLSALAQDLLDQDKMSAATWCCAGNCLDLQKDREQALKFFQRAIQVDPKFAYAYTLLGHQYMALEEMEKAMDCFKNAVRVDPIHYNGWYGMGIIYYKQERFAMAEFYFKKALAINKNSPVLKCHVAIVEHALQRTDKALAMLNSALAVEERNPLCKFHRASIYFACDRLDEALTELHELKEIAPREALVYYLMGNVYKKRNETHLALTYFSWANDLDPKGASGARRHIKEVIDPTSSLSLIVPAGSSSEQPLQASVNNDQQDEGSTIEGGNHSGASNNLSNESLEMPPLPSMDSDDGEHY